MDTQNFTVGENKFLTPMFHVKKTYTYLPLLWARALPMTVAEVGSQVILCGLNFYWTFEATLMKSLADGG
jgi:hypothetical protein